MWYKEIEKDRDYIFTYVEYDNGIEVTPSGASAIVYDNSGAVVETGIVGSISDNVMSFTFAAANNTTLGRNYKIEMVFTTNGVEKTVAYLFDVVNIPIQNVVLDENLFDYIKELRNGREVTGTIDSATTNTFTDSKLALDSRDWKGGRGTFLATTGNTDYKITSYTQSTGTAAFIPTLAQAPSGDYIMRMSYQDQIDDAYEYVLRSIRSKVGLAAGYIDTNTFNLLIIYRCLYIICLNEIEEPNDKWEIRKNEYLELYKSAFNAFNEAYDRDNDGNIDDEEAENPPSFATITSTRVRCQKSTRN